MSLFLKKTSQSFPWKTSIFLKQNKDRELKANTFLMKSKIYLHIFKSSKILTRLLISIRMTTYTISPSSYESRLKVVFPLICYDKLIQVCPHWFGGQNLTHPVLIRTSVFIVCYAHFSGHINTMNLNTYSFYVILPLHQHSVLGRQCTLLHCLMMT